ncbi:DoxX family protein [Actinomadura sp. DC4]|uniref:DoxX family protein n=1 Tax=Actinomadura sp. DC4 TaxID=3055069 RepID=UPI0025B19EEB|nr:DoxX family protein [Actinomadura sp. DC4]MDN3354517.1 DoxX family protein [Actinomadura sp. DC4]
MSNKPAIAYWMISLPVLLETGVGAEWDLARIKYTRDIFETIHFPLYFLTILGIAKVLAVLALLAPRLPRLKEWAYAGVFFVYAGATAAHLAVRDDAGIVMPLVFAALTLVSWGLRPPSRRDPAPLRLRPSVRPTRAPSPLK